MKKMKIGLTVISILLAVVKASEVFKIYRRKSEGVSGSEGATDSFKIPFSLCQLNASDAVNCKKFNARPVSYNSEKCYCSCPSDNNTFIFTDGQWTCLKNSALRVLLEVTSKSQQFRPPSAVSNAETRKTQSSIGHHLKTSKTS
ncbi:unnamed protein product [Porites lobata]|uniref:Uncharacterized protein n=1 Tax=Porites lobata TaxID=104759 RepID=A0ABN8P964_9CNID|nr:unnamed protein product [Porites lobata]